MVQQQCRKDTAHDHSQCGTEKAHHDEWLIMFETANTLAQWCGEFRGRGLVNMRWCGCRQLQDGNVRVIAVHFWTFPPVVAVWESLLVFFGLAPGGIIVGTLLCCVNSQGNFNQQIGNKVISVPFLFVFCLRMGCGPGRVLHILLETQVFFSAWGCGGEQGEVRVSETQMSPVHIS